MPLAFSPSPHPTLTLTLTPTLTLTLTLTLILTPTRTRTPTPTLTLTLTRWKLIVKLPAAAGTPGAATGCTNPRGSSSEAAFLAAPQLSQPAAPVAGCNPSLWQLDTAIMDT